MDLTKIDRTRKLLRIVFGVVPLVAGADKFTNILTDWTSYLSKLAVDLLPFAPSTFMAIVGVVEIAAGVLVLSAYTRIGAYIVAAWLALVAVSLIQAGHFDVAVRDVVM